MRTRVASGWNLIADPLPPGRALAITAAALIAGAAYCMGYAILSGGTNAWARAIGWSIGAVLPWLVLLEIVKRHESRVGRLSLLQIIAAVTATGIISLVVEYAIDTIVWNSTPAPLGLQLLRRAPPIGLVLLLLMLAGRSSDGAMQERDDAPGVIDPAGLRIVRAADNYVELHYAGRTTLRRETLRAVEAGLRPYGFVRVHRSVLVHPRHVVRVEAGGRTPVLVLDDGTRLPTGERYRETIRHFVP